MDEECNPDLGKAEWIDAVELDAIRSFVEQGVRFLVIGGRAVQFHGHLRPAKDLDLLVEVSPKNWGQLALALQPLGSAVPALDRLSPKKRYQAHLQFYPTVEFLTAIDGVSFEQAWPNSIETTFRGLPLRVLSKAHVILSKRDSARAVDLDDIKALNAL